MISEKLLTELTRALGYRKLRKRIPLEKAAAFANWVRDHAILAEDPPSPPPVGSGDPDDDLPILTPAQFAAKLRGSG